MGKFDDFLNKVQQAVATNAKRLRKEKAEIETLAKKMEDFEFSEGGGLFRGATLVFLGAAKRCAKISIWSLNRAISFGEKAHKID